MENNETTPRTAFDFMLELLAENQRKIEFCESDESGSIGFSELDKAKAKHAELITAALAIAPSVSAVVENFEDSPARRARINEIVSKNESIESIGFGLEDTPVIFLREGLDEDMSILVDVHDEQIDRLAEVISTIVNDLGVQHASVRFDGQGWLFDAALETLDGEDITEVLKRHIWS